MTPGATTKILYFAYGSNMLSRRLRERTPSAVVIGTGYVSGRRLTFDKVSTDHSGKCNIEVSASPTDRVYGVLFEFNAAEKSNLDAKEKSYHEDHIQVVTSSGTREAMTYVAISKEPALRPYHCYKALVIAGATEHHLPDFYIEWLRTVDSKPDPNASRRARKEAFLLGS